MWFFYFFNLKMAWGSGCAVIVQSLPLLLISCTKTEHSAISVLTHSCCVFISLYFPPPINQREHYIDICTYVYMYDVHQLDVGFPSYISKKIPCPRFCCTDLDFTVCSVVFMAGEAAVQVQCYHSVDSFQRRKTAVFSNDIHPIINDSDVA